jgi:hypothetical protein
MGQEVVYCFKCQKRITSADFAKGQAYQVENNFCCSACAVTVLETLPPKAKEQLLAKMFKATQERQSASPPSASSTARIPHATPRPMPVRAPSSSGPLILGIVVAAVVILLAVLFLSSGPTLTPAAAAPRPPAPLPDPGPSPEEKKRAEAAKQALRKARDFATANPKDLEGQLRQWRSALAESERTGYEVEVRRETEKADARNKEAVAQELADLERQARDLASKRDFKGALEIVDRARPKRSAPDWTSRLDALRRELEERSLAGPPWRPIFDGKSNGFLVTLAAQVWFVDNGALTRDTSKPDQAAQTREDYGDGEFRFRFTAEKTSGFFFTIRQAGGGACRVAYSKPMADALSAGPHELVFNCRGTTISATLDGASVPVSVDGTLLPRGRIQFNCSEGSFRLLAVEMRDLP